MLRSGCAIEHRVVWISSHEGINYCSVKNQINKPRPSKYRCIIERYLAPRPTEVSVSYIRHLSVRDLRSGLIYGRHQSKSVGSTIVNIQNKELTCTYMYRCPVTALDD